MNKSRRYIDIEYIQCTSKCSVFWTQLNEQIDSLILYVRIVNFYEGMIERSFMYWGRDW